ncbi:hypothetical protein VFC49_08305 [Thermococcus sp. SY098]|uniref:hypothetical protein n=1 Tax=Thermococcus sp. SY098 TaxID=3111325 RepID=UPI002D77D424|nr:hypothetical protein [Thermococcus sp. SY098]WRS52058.1 hypothetical protein VFC49_08305 [Thermococcus sp. SY098]
MSFTVRVYNSIGSGITAMLKLVVRDKNSGEVVYSEEMAINPDYLDDSEYTFTWSNVKAGDYTAEAKVIYNGEVKDTASISSINILARASSVVGGFDILPTEVYPGDAVTFHYIIRPIEGTELENPTVSLKIEDGDSFFSKTYYGATVTWDSYIEDYEEHEFNEAGNYTVLLLVDGAVVYSRTIEVKPLQGMVVKLDCPEEPVLLGETAICKIVVENNPVNQDLHYSISSKELDYNSNADNVISISKLKDRIPARYTGQIAQVNVPLDERLASALGLDDVRDLTPYTTHWVCPDGSCYYSRDRADTPHYLSITLWIENIGDNLLDNVIIARYEGSKYWREDAEGGIKKGGLMIVAPLGLAYAPVEYIGTMIVEMTPIPEPVKTAIQVFLFVRNIGQGIWKDMVGK